MVGNTRRALTFVGGAVMVVSLSVLGTLAAMGAFGSGQEASSELARQEQVAARGAEVMPFDLEATTHVFEKAETGGTQKVVADAPGDAGNVAAIRKHLREEADAFARGEFSDPASIHGEDMPGLAELEAGADRMEVRYEDLPDGGRVVFETDDPGLVAALHDWFDAQLHDHGDDAEEGASGDSQSGDGGRDMNDGGGSGGQSTDAAEHEEHH
jgi:hypothetical protein